MICNYLKDHINPRSNRILNENRLNDQPFKYHFCGIIHSNRKLTPEEPVHCFDPVTDMQLFVDMIYVFSYRFCTKEQLRGYLFIH
jgi:hypothetical protein